jgi:hypothetical protein
MTTEKQADKSVRENAIVVRDRRKPNQYTTDNVIAREWLPILRVGDALFFYSVYLSMANRHTESSWGSLRTMSQYLQCGIDLVIRGNKLLEICELIYIEPGNQHTTNEYYILDPPELDDSLVGRIHNRLDEIQEQETSKNWLSWIKQVRKALNRHRSLPDIWAARRAKRGGRPIKRPDSVQESPESENVVRQENQPEPTEHPSTDQLNASENPVRDTQAGLVKNPACDTQGGYTWDTTRVVVSHDQPACDTQAKQEQITRKNEQEDKESVPPPVLLSVRQKCRALGVATPVLDRLVARYPLEHLQKQLDWLPAREPRDPAAMFVRSVQEDWSPPAQYVPHNAEQSWQRWLEGIETVSEQPLPRSLTDADHIQEPSEPAQPNASQNLDLCLDIEGKSVDAQHIWTRVLHELEMQMTRVTFDTWLRGTQPVSVRKNGIVVQVRDDYAAEWIQSRLLVPIRRTLKGIAGQSIDVFFELR